MKKKVLIVVYIIVILITTKILYHMLATAILLFKYNNGIYDEKQAKSLTYWNVLENYVSYYNYGNVLFKNGQYDYAIEEYKKALKGYVPKAKECNIRINYALAICNTVELNENDKKSIEDAIQQYESAIEVLTENGCANKNDNKGHSKEAEQLKSDIQKEIERLKKLQQGKNNDNNKNEDEKENRTQESAETIEEKMQEIKEDAVKDQREKESSYTEYKKGFNDGNKRNW